MQATDSVHHDFVHLQKLSQHLLLIISSNLSKSGLLLKKSAVALHLCQRRLLNGKKTSFFFLKHKEQRAKRAQVVGEHNTGLLLMSQVTTTLCVQKYKVYKTAQQSCLNCLHNYSGCDVHPQPWRCAPLTFTNTICVPVCESLSWTAQDRTRHICKWHQNTLDHFYYMIIFPPLQTCSW